MAEERGSSRTALSVAVLRAAHQLIDDEPRILDDPIVLRLLDPRALDGIRADVQRLREPRMAGLRSHVVVRSRYTEDSLAKAVQGGIGQYVILGAGLDTFAYRQPDWARDLRVFEVDHPATQRTKRERLRSAGIDTPPNLEYVAVDFEHGSLRAALLQSSLNLSQPTFFSFLGVLVYLDEKAVDEVFRLVASFPGSSQMVLDFSPPERPGEASSSSSTASRAAASGEPWLTRLEPEQLAEKLRGLGFSEVVLLTPAETEELYLKGRRDGLRPPPGVRIALVVV